MTAFWRWGPRGRRMAPGIDFDAKLAEALGISLETLRAAEEAALTNSIQEAVNAGELAPKKAQHMLTWQKLRPYLDRQVLAAQVLDKTSEELQQAPDENESWPDLLAEQQMDPRTAWRSFREAGKAAIQRAVADGVINQEEADEFLSRRGGRRHFGWRSRRCAGHGRHHNHQTMA